VLTHSLNFYRLHFPDFVLVIIISPSDVAVYKQTCPCVVCTQERERFRNPHKAFTYRMHGYEAVVGPVKGMLAKENTMKPREHALLVKDRPSYVTILTLGIYSIMFTDHFLVSAVHCKNICLIRLLLLVACLLTKCCV